MAVDYWCMRARSIRDYAHTLTHTHAQYTHTIEAKLKQISYVWLPNDVNRKNNTHSRLDGRHLLCSVLRTRINTKHHWEEKNEKVVSHYVFYCAYDFWILYEIRFLLALFLNLTVTQLFIPSDQNEMNSVTYFISRIFCNYSIARLFFSFDSIELQCVQYKCLTHVVLPFHIFHFGLDRDLGIMLWCPMTSFRFQRVFFLVPDP